MVGVTTVRTRVVLAADDVLLREGLAGMLDRSGFEVAGQAGNMHRSQRAFRDPANRDMEIAGGGK